MPLFNNRSEMHDTEVLHLLEAMPLVNHYHADGSRPEAVTGTGVWGIPKHLSQWLPDPRKIPAEYLDENGNWRMLDRRERATLTDGQLYAYFNERY